MGRKPKPVAVLPIEEMNPTLAAAYREAGCSVDAIVRRGFRRALVAGWLSGTASMSHKSLARLASAFGLPVPERDLFPRKRRKDFENPLQAAADAVGGYREAARICGVTPDTFYQWVRNGKGGTTCQLLKLGRASGMELVRIDKEGLNPVVLAVLEKEGWDFQAVARRSGFSVPRIYSWSRGEGISRLNEIRLAKAYDLPEAERLTNGVEVLLLLVRGDQQAIADACGVRPGAIKYWIQTGLVPAARVKALSEKFGIPAHELNPRIF